MKKHFYIDYYSLCNVYSDYSKMTSKKTLDYSILSMSSRVIVFFLKNHKVDKHRQTGFYLCNTYIDILDEDLAIVSLSHTINTDIKHYESFNDLTHEVTSLAKLPASVPVVKRYSDLTKSSIDQGFCFEVIKPKKIGIERTANFLTYYPFLKESEW